MKRICVFIGFIALLSACTKKYVTPDNHTVVIGGTTYPTVIIGDQVWTTANLKGFNGYHSNAHSQYGDYYSALFITLPTGWRAPTIADYNKLMSNFTSTDKDQYGYFHLNAAEVAPLLSTTGWPAPLQGTNQSGFNAQPAGFFSDPGQGAIYHGGSAYFATSDVNPENGTFGFSITADGAYVKGAKVSDTSYYFSVRFVMDRNSPPL